MLLRSKGARISPKLTTEFDSVVLMVPASTAWKIQDWEKNGSILCGFRKRVNPGNMWQAWSRWEDLKLQIPDRAIVFGAFSGVLQSCFCLIFLRYAFIPPSQNGNMYPATLHVGIMEFGFAFYRKSVKRLPCVSKDNLKFWTVVRLLKMMRTFDCIMIWPWVNESYGQNMVLCLRNVPYQCSYGTCWIWSLAGESMSLGAGFEGL